MNADPIPRSADELSSLISALAAMFCGRVQSLQLWVDDDLGLHPRAWHGRVGGLRDRRLARQCGLLAAAQRIEHCIALPLALSDRRVGAVVAEFSAALLDEDVDRMVGWINQQQGLLDRLLSDDRLTRMSGVARRAEALRLALTAAHALEQVESLRDGFAALHRCLRELMEADNFFVVLLDEQREWLNFPYAYDQYDHNWEPISFRQGRLQGSMSAIIVAAGRVLRGSSEELLEQAGHGDTSDNDTFGPNASDWLGVPMLMGAEVSGAMVVQSYQPGFKFADEDPGALSMLAEASAAALYRRRVRETLERLVLERTSELRVARDQAEQTLRELRITQKQLVMSEKMASLGQLVAGVAHEVNTPLGVALTAASLIDVQTQALDQRFREGRLTRGDMQRFVEQANESVSMVVRNLQRAAGLVQSFKQVSVDRVADERQRFVLADLLTELLDSSRSLWASRPIEVVLSCEPALELESYPTTLAQVVSNLIHNALIHAFAAQDAGRIEVSARAHCNDEVDIEVRDDGVGVPAEICDKVFEPFVTTRRNRGGTGLGLHIVFNLVTQTLGGHIELDSTPGQGCAFRLRLPKSAPA